MPVERRSSAGRALVGRRSGAGRAPLGTYAVNIGYPQYKTDKCDINLCSLYRIKKITSSGNVI